MPHSPKVRGRILLEIKYKRMLPQGVQKNLYYVYDHTLPLLQHLALIPTTLHTFVWVQPL